MDPQAKLMAISHDMLEKAMQRRTEPHEGCEMTCLNVTRYEDGCIGYEKKEKADVLSDV